MLASTVRNCDSIALSYLAATSADVVSLIAEIFLFASSVNAETSDSIAVFFSFSEGVKFSVSMGKNLL